VAVEEIGAAAGKTRAPAEAGTTTQPLKMRNNPVVRRR